MSRPRPTSLWSYGFLRICWALREMNFYHARMLMRTLRQGSWRSIREEIFPADAVANADLHRPLGEPFVNQNQKGILVIDRSLPRFDRDAGSRATWQYIRLLRQMGFRVTVWGHDFLRREPYATMLEEMGVEVVSGMALVCGRWRAWIRARAHTLQYVVIHRPNVATTYMQFLRKATDARILYFGVDLRWLRNQRRYQVEGDPFFLAEARHWQAIENRLVATADAAYFYSQSESDIVATQVAGARVRTVPLFISEETESAGGAFVERAGLMFVGGFAHQPNVDAILWFVNEIYPAVREQLGAIALRIVGTDPPESLRGRPGIEIAGAISDAELRKCYDASRIVVAPLRYGAGIKGKVVEALFHCIPVVTTPIGAEGMPDASQVLEVCERPDEFAAAVVRIYRDEAAWSARRASMNAYVEEHFSADKARRVLEQDFCELPSRR